MSATDADDKNNDEPYSCPNLQLTDENLAVISEGKMDPNIDIVSATPNSDAILDSKSSQEAESDKCENQSNVNEPSGDADHELVPGVDNKEATPNSDAILDSKSSQEAESVVCGNLSNDNEPPGGHHELMPGNKEDNKNELVVIHTDAVKNSDTLANDIDKDCKSKQDDVDVETENLDMNTCKNNEEYDDMCDDDDEDMKLRWDDDDDEELISDDLSGNKEAVASLGNIDNPVLDKIDESGIENTENKMIMDMHPADKTDKEKENIKDVIVDKTQELAGFSMEGENKLLEDKYDNNVDQTDMIKNKKYLKNESQKYVTGFGDTTAEDVTLDENIITENVGNIDISMEMEDKLLKDEQLEDINDKLDNSDTKMSIDTPDVSIDKLTTDIEETIQALDKTENEQDNEKKHKCLEVETTPQDVTAVPKQSIISILKKSESNENEDLNAEKVQPVADDTIKEEIRSLDSSTSEMSMENSIHLIKTDHALTKPDAMLEIPTQELIDIDDTDMSINLDESFDSENDEKLASSTMTENKGMENLKTVTKEDLENVTNIVDKAKPSGEILDKPVELDNKGEVNSGMPENVSKDIALVGIGKETSTVEKTTTEDSQIASIADQEVQPSTSSTVPISTEMSPDTSDEVPESTDSLGLLAESSGRAMEDDEDPEDDDDGDEDDDFDPEDESSNPMTAEHSEDSNAQQSETEAPKDQDETGLQEIQSPVVNETGELPFRISNIESEIQAEIERKDMEEDAVECTEDNLELTVTEETVLLDEENQVSEEILEETLVKVADAAMKEIEKEQLAIDEVEIETVKLSDTSDNEIDVDPGIEPDDSGEVTDAVTPGSSSEEPAAQPLDESKKSPSKKKKLEVSQGSVQPIFNIVDLEDSDDEIKEVKKKPDQQKDKFPAAEDSDVTSVNIPKGIDVMSTSGGTTSDMVSKEGEVVISGVPKPAANKHTSFIRLNTNELSIKTTTSAPESTLVITEAKATEDPLKEVSRRPKIGLEIFSLDSDEEDIASSAVNLPIEKPKSPKASTPEPEKPHIKCINSSCSSGPDVPHALADAATAAYYGATKKRKPTVCQACAGVVARNTQDLIKGIKEFSPLLDLCAGKMSQDLVEISDSDDEEEDNTEITLPPAEPIGGKAAKLLEENLADLINETWRKYKLDERLRDTESQLNAELEKLDKESKEIDQMMNECQVATDKLRKELYASFEHERQELPGFIIYDTPNYNFMGLEQVADTTSEPGTRQSKRRLSSASEVPAKKAAIPLGYAPLDSVTKQVTPQDANQKDETSQAAAMDDDKDISVVKLSAEAAPASLPPPGELTRAPLRVGMSVFAMRNAFGPWLGGKVLECQPRNNQSPFSMCRVKFDHKIKNPCKILAARSLAYSEPADVRMTIGTRVIALFKDHNADKRESFYSGVVAEIPNPVNSYRYLVFFDDGYAQYVQHSHTRLVCESSSLVWEEVHPFSRDFVREYLLAYPERPMVRLHEGQSLKTEWNGKWLASKVVRVDASLAQVSFTEDGRKEWIYRGSTRLAPLYLELKAAERHRQRPMPRSKAQTRSNMPYVEYTRSEEPAPAPAQQETPVQQLQNEDIRRQRAVAKKSTSVPAPAPPAPAQPAVSNLDTVTSRVVYYTPKNAVKPFKMTPHTCGPKCKRTDVLSLKELRTYNPLAKPLLSGWERQIVRFKGHKQVMYRAPCGRRVRGLRELHRYLRLARSDLPVDLFDFHPATHCLAEFVLNKCLVGKKDLSHGKENVPVPCVNYYDESLPEFCSYNTERTPTAGVPLNLDPEFLCGCDCTDDCQDKSKCACWKMTLEGAHTIGFEGDDLGYKYKRLPEPLPSGIYECNSRCKCKDTCLNRVAQHPLQLKLQVFKTLNRGWGIRALNDVPKGAFLCVYAGNLLTDATANLDGLNEGDEYLAELDYIEVVEQMKEGYEEDIPAADKRLDKKELAKQKKTAVEEEDEEEEISSSDDEERPSKNEKEDDDFQPGYPARDFQVGDMEFSKRLRKRDKASKEEEEKPKEKGPAKDEEDCITISDDEEVREPSRFMAQAGMGGNEFISKYKSVRALFGEDEACYIMDAKVQGNIGRYLNHSCTPNVFVQNVFVDTHDPRFPWVAFFALSHIKAGTELTWNYNYDVGSVPGKVLYCYCGAPNCRGRLL